MKHVGIITIDKVNNYGADLQAIALEKAIERLGCKVEIIDYVYYKNWWFKDSKKSSPFIKQGIKQRILYFIKYRIINFIIDKILPIVSKSARNRKAAYKSFEESSMLCTREYKSFDDLYRNPPEFDIYITGSDQVWNPGALSSIEPYFLTFAPHDKPKLSYASSFGVSHIQDSLKEKYKTLLENFDALSVREYTGAMIIQDLTGLKAEVVLDPTLLLDRSEWSEYMKPYRNINGDYIIIYQLYPSQTIINMAESLSKKLSIPVFRICKRGFAVGKDPGIYNISDAGPAEFLWLIANARYAITNSFHGTAFSLNFSVPFSVVLSKKKTNNSRMISLLDSLGLTERIIYEEDCITDFNTEVDFSSAYDKLALLKESSIRYLKNNINI